jgi:hypothetical protein
MCLPVSRLFWVSSIAYPNLLGTKGYVVVVVCVVLLKLKCTKKNCNILGAGSEPAWRAEWDMGKKRMQKKIYQKK